MQIADIITTIETWAPKWAAWEKDNVGLQVGDPQQPVTRVLVALDVTESVIEEAIAKKVELIVSHHPLLFRPPATITTQHPVGKLILTLAEHHIAVYSSHTNLDSANGGVSFSLAQVLGLHNVRFLSPLRETLAKIVVFVPEGHVERVRKSMANAGAGMIGEYDECSFAMTGKGSFRGSESSKPFLGKAGQGELTEEVRLEMLAPRARVDAIVHAMKEVHPYEEVAYDVYPLSNSNPNFGMGAVGEISKPQSLPQFLSHLKRRLNLKAVKYSGTTSKKIQRVAVCGGAGNELLQDAIHSGAQVFITADVRYHTFQSALNQIVLVDAGHYETEQVVIKPLAERIQEAARTAGSSLSVSITKQVTNPVNIV
ncbi:MAG TPA: Nif3-like dinuclear metal center hexameric protein [Bacteroidota bacterium]|nr:Nif3-like dinuclear metal center hexameric protein [Bacteroidota bacterium]